MIRLSTDAALANELIRYMKGNHRISVELTITDLSHNALLSISHRLLSGQVTFDATADVTRQMNLELFDPHYQTALDDADPGNGSGYPTAMIKCVYKVGSMDGQRFFQIPLFHGPVTKVDRDGFTLSVECSGKEVLSSGALLNGITGYKGWNRGTIIRHMMTTYNGEQFFDMESTNLKTVSAIAATPEAYSLWTFIKAMAKGNNHQVFYDGRGYLRTRTRPNKPVFTFDDEWMTQPPQVGYDASGVYNVVDMEGATPKKAKNPIKVRVYAPAGHPMSGQSLARGGVPQWRVLKESNGDIKEVSKLREVATDRLNNSLLQAVEVAVPTKIMPLLEEEDWIAFKGDNIYIEQRIKKWTIPLIASTGTMTVGYTQNVKPKNRLPRARKK